MAFLLAVPATAQGPPAAEPLRSTLTPAIIAETIERIAASPTLSEEDKQRAVELYEQASGELVSAREWKAKAAEFERLRIEAPALLERVRREKQEAAEPSGLEGDLASLEQALAQAEAELAAAGQRLSELDGERKRRSERRVEVPRRLAEANRSLPQLSADQGPAPSGEPALAEWTYARAHRQALEAEVESLGAEIYSYDARRDLLAARLDKAAHGVSVLERRVGAIRDAANEQRRIEAERSTREAISATKQLEGKHPLLERLAAENAELATMRSGPDGLAERIKAAKGELSEVAASAARLSERFEGARQRTEAVGFTEAIGLLLRKQRAELPDIRERLRRIRLRQGEIGKAQLRLLELEEQRGALRDIEALARSLLLQAQPAPVTPEDSKRLLASTRELLEAKREYLGQLIADYDTYFVTLVDLDASERELIDKAQRYATFIDEHVLWIRSGSVLGLATVRDAWPALRWLTAPVNLRELGAAAGLALLVRPAGVAVVVLAWLCVLAYRRRLRDWLETRCQRDRERGRRSVLSTCASLTAAVLIAAPWPLLLLLVAWLLVAAEGGAGSYAGAVAIGLARTGLSYLGLSILRQICRKNGPGQVYFGWSERATSAVRRTTVSLAVLALPAMFLVYTLDAQSNEAWKHGLGRIALLVALGVVATFGRRLARPENGVLEGLGLRSRSQWFLRLRAALPAIVVVPPLLLAVFAAAGYEFAALHLARKLEATAWTGLALLVADTLAIRWMIAARRQLAIRQAEEAREAAIAQEGQSGSDAAPVDEDQIDLSAVNAQTRRLIRSFVVLAGAASLWMIWSDVLPALRIFDRVELWTVTRSIGEQVTSNGSISYQTVTRSVPITLSDLLEALVIVVMTVVAGRNLPGFLEFTILQRLPLGAGIRYALTSVSRYVISVIGVVMAFAAVGVRWAQVQWLVAAMTVGLGFGLQEIFANFVSGLIILLERPIRLGDTVTLGDVNGTVSRIRIRATTIVDWDRKELIVPNKEFITGQLVNWTLSDQLLRIVVPVGIAYGSDTRLAEKLLLEIARDSSYVVEDPEPTVIFDNFGDNSLEFELRAYIAKFEYYWHARHDLRMQIDAAFRKAGIEIAFPQRDLHLRSVGRPIPVTLREPETPA